MTIDEEIDKIKIGILNGYIRREGKNYWFFHDLASDVVFSQDKLVPLFKGLHDVAGDYNITSGYLSLADAEKSMRGI